MKTITKTLISNRIPAGVIATGLALALFAFTAVIAKADIAPIITTAVHNGSHTSVTSVSIGSLVHANALVASSSGPTATGTVDFSLYGNTTCAGTPTIQAGVALSSGAAESATTTVTGTGLSYKVHYNGLTDIYPPTDGQCTALSVTAPSTTIGITLSTTTTYVGNSVYASSTIGNSTANATGTVAYNVYNNNVCTTGTQSAGSKTVTNGIVPVSDTLQFNTVGTFYFQAVYSGDQNNSAATSSCQSGVLSVIATSTPPTPPPPPPAPGTGSVSGKLYHDLDKDRTLDVGESGLAGRTIKLYNAPNWKKSNLFASTTTNANGDYVFNNLPAGTYSIEEINVKGFNQITADYKSVLVGNGAVLTGYDFADATSTKKADKDRDHDGKRHEKKDKDEKKDNNGNKKSFGEFKNFGQFVKYLRLHWK